MFIVIVFPLFTFSVTVKNLTDSFESVLKLDGTQEQSSHNDPRFTLLMNMKGQLGLM